MLKAKYRRTDTDLSDPDINEGVGKYFLEKRKKKNLNKRLSIT